MQSFLKNSQNASDKKVSSLRTSGHCLYCISNNASHRALETRVVLFFFGLFSASFEGEGQKDEHAYSISIVVRLHLCSCVERDIVLYVEVRYPVKNFAPRCSF